MSLPAKGQHNLNHGVAGVVSLGALGKELFRVISVLRWKHSRDDITQFYLLVALYKTHLDAELRWNASKRGGVGKFSALKDRVDNLKEKMKRIQKEENEENAKRYGELVLAEMRELITKEAQLDPHKDRFFKDHWGKAEANKQKFLEKKARDRSNSGSSASRHGAPITLNIRINIGDSNRDLSRFSERQLVFPSYFRDSYLNTLVPYALSRERSKDPQRGQGMETRALPPMKRQPMDALYLRFIDAEKRAHWNLVDRDRKMTVGEFQRRTKQDPTAEIRFLSCRMRFVLLATHNNGKNYERILDLDKDKKQLIHLLDTQAIRDDKANNSSDSRKTRTRGASQESASSRQGRDLIKTIQPQACLVLVGNDPFMLPEDDEGTKGCQCTIC